MTVRSSRLALGQFSLTAGVNIVVYTVPPGTVTIVRSVLIHNVTASTQTYLERARVSGVQVGLRSITLPTLETNLLEMWRVLEAGDEYILRSAVTALVNVWLSGAELVT